MLVKYVSVMTLHRLSRCSVTESGEWEELFYPPPPVVEPGGGTLLYTVVKKRLTVEVR